MISLPCYGGLVSDKTAKGLFHLGKELRTAKVDHGLLTLSNESLITRGRSKIVNFFMNNTEYERILFIDADIGFNHKNIERLLMKDKEIVCGVYPIKDFLWNLAKEAIKKNPDITPLELERNSLRYAINFEDPQNINIENGYAVVKDAATGMMLVKREVFNKLILSYPERKYH